MTTLVAVRKHDQIAIAADSLTTFGDVRLASDHDRSFDKIVSYRGNYIGLCGSAAHQLAWNATSDKFWVRSVQGAYVAFTFNGTAMSATRIPRATSAR